MGAAIKPTTLMAYLPLLSSLVHTLVTLKRAAAAQGATPAAQAAAAAQPQLPPVTQPQPLLPAAQPQPQLLPGTGAAPVAAAVDGSQGAVGGAVGAAGHDVRGAVSVDVQGGGCGEGATGEEGAVGSGRATAGSGGLQTSGKSRKGNASGLRGKLAGMVGRPAKKAKGA